MEYVGAPQKLTHDIGQEPRRGRYAGCSTDRHRALPVCTEGRSREEPADQERHRGPRGPPREGIVTVADFSDENEEPERDEVSRHQSRPVRNLLHEAFLTEGSGH